MILRICGITVQEDASAAIEAGATAVGFNFYPHSPRYLNPEIAAEIATASDIGRLRAAGYSAFLVGEHLMKSGHPAGALRALVTA